jgi:hypothetical protein
VISNQRGPVVIRRADYKQTSLASYERFYNSWTTASSWNTNDAVFGPVHSNSDVRLSSSAPGTRFWSKVTAVGTITYVNPTLLRGGYQTGVPRIPFPTDAQIQALQPLAAGAGLVIAGDTRMSADDPEVRIEFVAIDLNGDGDTNDDDEGFVRVYRTSAAATQAERNYVSALRWNETSSFPGWPGANNSSDPNLLSPNCGGVLRIAPAAPRWLRADSIADSLTLGAAVSRAERRDSVRNAFGGNRRRCYLGGDRALFDNQWIINTPYGQWTRWAGWGASAPAALVNAIAAQGVDPSTDAGQVALTFWPINRTNNPNTRGVIYVTGSLAVSGKVRGQVTLVADGNIMIADDITYVQAPNTTCADILGLISRRNIELQDNNVNTPFNVNNNPRAVFDDTPDETIHGFLLGLNRVGGDDLSGGEPAVPPEDCGGSFTSSRGCRFLVGGIAQSDYTTSYSGSTGWHDQDHYDQCGALNPPPYYPTTGSFTKYRYFEIDPVGFDPVAWFNANQ